MTSPSPIELSVREPRSRLLDEPLVLRARAGAGDELTWRARYRDDDGRVWKAVAGTPADLAFAWEPAKPQTGPLAALGSLRPVNVDVRVETADGRAAGRQVTRLLLGEGVRARRWRDGPAAALYLPSDAVGSALVLDATAGSPHATAVATLAAALLASRGVVALAVTAGDLGVARDRLAAVPAVGGEAAVLGVLDPYGDAPPAGGVVLPPGVAARDLDGSPARARAAAWDALLERLGARPRVPA